VAKILDEEVNKEVPMISDNERKKAICNSYSEDFWEKTDDILPDLVAKFENPNHCVPNNNINAVHRAVIVFRHLMETIPTGSTILDIGCGVGQNARFLAQKGYRVIAFDGSESGISKARKLADEQDLDPDIFVQSDHMYLEQCADNSIDGAIAMGFIYYLDNSARDYCYKHIRRILKPGGSFYLTLTNKIFNAFALNDTSLSFWAEVIDKFSPAARLFGADNVREQLEKKISVPQRVFEKRSISRKYTIHEDNPIVYHQIANQYAFDLVEISYPDSHLLPPFLESEVDPKELALLKAVTILQKHKDWSGMLMDYEFLAFLKKSDG